jgi:hypothetical protein
MFTVNVWYISFRFDFVLTFVFSEQMSSFPYEVERPITLKRQDCRQLRGFISQKIGHIYIFFQYELQNNLDFR